MSHPPIASGKTGLLLVNLGTPEATNIGAVRRYLKEFLSDQRVIELSPFLWQPILRGIILNTRPRKSARAYAKIWREESNESPLRYYTRQQACAVQDAFGKQLIVDYAMRYGHPSIAEKIEALTKKGCDKIMLMALYPQYSATTMASVYDEAFRVLQTMRRQPAIRTLAAWHNHPAYIEAVAKSITRFRETHKKDIEKIIISFHGLPQSYFDAGDHYYCHCAKTTRLLREKLGMDETNFILSFQSRFGPRKWLQPYTTDIVQELAQAGVKNIAVITPGFISDCIETLEEINIELQADFLSAGGETFSFIPCLNDTPDAIGLLTQLARENLGGWL